MTLNCGAICTPQFHGALKLSKMLFLTNPLGWPEKIFEIFKFSKKNFSLSVSHENMDILSFFYPKNRIFWIFAFFRGKQTNYQFFFQKFEKFRKSLKFWALYGQKRIKTQENRATWKLVPQVSFFEKFQKMVILSKNSSNLVIFGWFLSTFKML